MSPTDPVFDDDERFDDDFGVMDEDAQEQERRGLIAALSGWGSSLAVHAVLIALLTSIVLFQEQKREPLPPVVMQPPEDMVEQIIDDITEREPVEVPELEVEPTEDQTDTAALSELELPEPVEDNAETEEPIDEPELAAEAGEIDLQSSAAFMVIGPGSNASGGGGDMFSKRGRQARGGPGSGIPRRRVQDVERALRWFKRHQSPDGSWDVDGYPDNCTDGGPRCEPGTAHTQMETGDVACTGYALLCFLGSGYDHKTPNRYRGTVDTALRWLEARATDAPDGRGIILSKNIYAQAVAAKAVIEAYGMTGDRRLRRLAEGVTERLVALQNPSDDGYGLGWNYQPSASRNDASVSGWVIMALKSAAASGLDVGNSMTGAKHYVRQAWQDMNPGWERLGSDDLSGFPYSWNPQTKEAKKESLAPAGALCAIFMGAKQGDVMLETMCNYIERKQTPTTYPCNTYYVYYNTFAMFQAGGDRWRRWNEQVMPLLQDAQRKDGTCFDGSWDYQGTVFHGHETGRLLSTAYNCLCLQVQWMYTRIEG